MKITVKELISQLRLHDADAEVYFQGLSFYRVKSRGETICAIEFRESPVKKDDKFLIFQRVAD